MIVGIDASRAFQKNRTGIEEYSYQVIKNLKDKLTGHQVVLYIKKNQKSKIKSQNDNSKLKSEELEIPKNWKVKIIKFPYLWTQIGLSLELLFHPADVLFIPAHVVPAIHPKNTIVTIHGLEYEFFPQGYSFWARLYMRWSIKLSCRWAKTVIAVSNNTKKDLMRLYKVPEGKIEVIYEGVNENFEFRISNFETNSNFQNSNLKIDSKFKIQNSKFILFIGRLEKRKNIEGIIEAYKILKEKYNVSHSLVLAGKPGYSYEIIKLKIENLFKISNFKFQIIELGYVDEKDKPELIKNADVFLFPTFYEGFGLPILEAQNMGVPVVTSNISSLPEVGGKSVLYADPYKPESIADAAFRLISDKSLKDDIIEKGHENVKKFSWKKCAEEIARILREK